MFSPKNFVISSLIFNFLIHFVFVHGIRKYSVSFFCTCLFSFSQTTYRSNCLSPTEYSWFLCCKLIDHVSMGLVWPLCSVPLIYVYVFVPFLYCFDFYSFVLIRLTFKQYIGWGTNPTYSKKFAYIFTVSPPDPHFHICRFKQPCIQ